MEDALKFAGADCLLLPKDVSVLLGCEVGDARRLMQLGYIPCIRFGRIIKARKFAVNEALIKLDGKDVQKLLNNA